jgi:hypothetical protein
VLPISNKSSLLHRIFGIKKSYTQLRLRADTDDFDRAEIFLDDVRLLTKMELPDFDVGDLVLLLYEDFLYSVRDRYDQKHLVQSLEDKRNFYFKRSRHDWSAEDDEESIYFTRPRRVSLVIRMRLNSETRGRVLLNDLSRAVPSFSMEMEELTSILFMDFIAEVRKGNQRRLIRALIDRLED